MSPEKALDITPRNKGTILNILKHEIDSILDLQEIRAEPHLENNEVKFIDYTFQHDPPELDIFEEVRIRIFDKSRIINESIQTHIRCHLFSCFCDMKGLMCAASKTGKVFSPLIEHQRLYASVTQILKALCPIRNFVKLICRNH